MSPEEFKALVGETFGPDAPAPKAAPEAFVFCAGCGSRMALAALEGDYCAACRQSERRRRAAGGAQKSDPDEALAFFTDALEADGAASVPEKTARTASRPRAESPIEAGLVAMATVDTPAPKEVPVAPSGEAVVTATSDGDEIVECKRCHGKLSVRATVDGRHCLVCYDTIMRDPALAAQFYSEQAPAIAAQTSEQAARGGLLDAVRLVAELRERAETARLAVRDSKLLWEVANAEKIDAAKAAAAAVDVAEAALRTAAEVEFLVTGDKRPAPGVAIRVLTTLSYDQGEALDWCTDHRSFLSFDRKNFEAFAKKFPDQVAFVESSEEPQIMLAVDLRSALEAQR